MMKWPEGKQFAFSIFDDTDVATLEYIRPIYDTLTSLGMYTTKSVWSLNTSKKSPYSGSHTLEDKPYADYINELQDRGFEIAFHGASMVSTSRPQILKALNIFKEVTGQFPTIYAPHASNKENIYWGETRFSIPLFKNLFSLIFKEQRGKFKGHLENNDYFWGDIAKQYFKYIRGFTYNDLNLFNVGIPIVYHNQFHPWINNWFFTTDADNVEVFNQVIAEKNQDELIKNNGICIISTHLGKGFLSNGILNIKTRQLLERLCQNNGWFVPVSTILDYLNGNNISTSTSLTWIQRFFLEAKWFIHAYLRSRKPSWYNKTEISYLKKSIAKQMDNK